MMIKAMKVIAWCLALLVIILCVIPAPKIVEVSNVDKVEHALAFAARAFVFLRAYRHQVIWVITGCVAFGVGIELVQYFIPWRSAELADLVADIVGVLLGWMAFIIFSRFRAKSSNHE